MTNWSREKADAERYDRGYDQPPEPISDEQMIALVLDCKNPRVQCVGEKNMLIIGLDEYFISMDQADVLFQTMFFRGKL